MDEKTVETSCQTWNLPETGFLRLDRARHELMRQVDDLALTANGLSAMAHFLRYADYDSLECVAEALDKARRAGPL